jgi:ATP-binding cassette subfamily B protein
MLRMADKPDKPARAGTFRRIVGYFRPYRMQVGVVLVAMVVTAVLGLGNPILLSFITNTIVNQLGASHRPIAHPNFVPLTIFAGLMVVIPIVTNLIGVLQTYQTNKVGQSVMRDFRNNLFRHLQAMSFQFFSETKTGEIQSRLQNDVGGIQDVVTNTAASTVSNIAIALTTVVGMAFLSWQLTLISLGLLPVFLYMTFRIGKLRRVISRQTQETMAEMSALTQENLSVSGILLTKVFGQQQRAITRFETENQRLATLELRQQMLGRWFFMMMGTFFSAMPAVTYFVAGHLILGGAGGITLGTIVAITTLQTRLFFPVGQLLQVQVQAQGALALFDRIFEFLDLPIDISNRPSAIPLDSAEARGDIVFDNVQFRYGARQGSATEVLKSAAAAEPAKIVEDRTISAEMDPRPAIDGVSFEALPGQLVALVGPSGAGKTTITYLASRLYDVQSGSVRIDGHDVRDLQLESLAQMIGMVTQETYLFHTSIRENLLFARSDATDKELWAALEAANISEKIAQLPDGLDTIVGERGYRLSGGEKQRLAIGRVVLKDPKILILDEATSALDTHSERAIQSALQPLMRGRTTLAIAHRLSTILRADQILMIAGGRIVERGSHAQLIELGGAYARLYREQFADGHIEAECEDGVIEAAS